MMRPLSILVKAWLACSMLRMEQVCKLLLLSFATWAALGVHAM